MPPSAGLPRANQRADANAIGVVALSLLLGRVLAIEEYPVAAAGAGRRRRASIATVRPSPLSTAFSNWLTRALQFDVRTAFQSPSEAQLAFESVLASDRSYVTSSAKLEEWVANVGGRSNPKARQRRLTRGPAQQEPHASKSSHASQVDASRAAH